MQVSQEWVIDAQILSIADDPLDERCLDAIELLNEILRSHILVLDDRRFIESQYEGNLKVEGHSRTWWRRIQRSVGKRMTYSGQLSNRHRLALLRLQNLQDDLVYIAVAHRSSSKVLVSEDSDYSEDVKQYLENLLDIQVLSVAKALAIIRGG